jgi:hypothetical protein
MATKPEPGKSARLDKSALEKALEEVCEDQQDQSKESTMMINAHENTAGVDPNFAGKLHDKLAETAGDPEPSGLRAPCTTAFLSAQDLAQLDDEEADDVNVVIDTKSHGKIDQIDSKLVTELTSKLIDEASHPNEKQSFAAALGNKLSDLEIVDGAQYVAATHGAIDKIDDKLVLELQRKLGNFDEPTEPGEAAQVDASAVQQEVGFRAPQNTMKISADMLNALDDDDEHAPVDASHPNLMAQLQQRLEADAEEPEDDVPKRGCRAPKPTVKLSEDLLRNLEEDDDVDIVTDDAIAVAPEAAAAVCLAQAKVAEANQEAVGDTSKDEGGVFDATFAAALHHKLADQSEEHNGLRAPEPTKLISADMLAGIDDDDDEIVDSSGGDILAKQVAAKLASETSAEEQVTPSNAKTLHKKRSVNFRNSGAADADFATSLSKKLQDANPEETPTATADIEPDTPQAGTKAPPGTKVLSDAMLAGVWDEDAEDERFEAGRRAPQTTQVLTANQLKQLDDDDDGTVQRSLSEAPETFADGDDVETPAFASGRRAPQCTAVLTSDQLAMLDEDEDLMAPPPNAMEKVFAAKVIQNMQEAPSNGKPATSSCKLRLAWLSNEEIQKENDQLRQEIASLRAQVNMHKLK